MRINLLIFLTVLIVKNSKAIGDENLFNGKLFHFLFFSFIFLFLLICLFLIIFYLNTILFGMNV